MIKTNIWSDAWFVALNERAQRLFLYLITNEHTRISGFYQLPMFKIVAQMGWDEKETLKQFKLLEPKAIYFEGWVVLPNYQRHQNVANNPKVQLAIDRELGEVPQSVLNRKSEIINHNSVGMDRVSIGYPAQENGSTEPQKSVGKKGGKTGDSIKAGAYSEDFERFWGVYPRKVGKGAAYQSWLKLNPNASLVEKIISTTLLYTKTTQWMKEGGQYIPHAQTFLNQRRFDDTPQVTGGSVGGGKYQGL